MSQMELWYHLDCIQQSIFRKIYDYKDYNEETSLNDLWNEWMDLYYDKLEALGIDQGGNDVH